MQLLALAGLFTALVTLTAPVLADTRMVIFRNDPARDVDRRVSFSPAGRNAKMYALYAYHDDGAAPGAFYSEAPEKLLIDEHQAIDVTHKNDAGMEVTSKCWIHGTPSVPTVYFDFTNGDHFLHPCFEHQGVTVQCERPASLC